MTAETKTADEVIAGIDTWLTSNEPSATLERDHAIVLVAAYRRMASQIASLRAGEEILLRASQDNLRTALLQVRDLQAEVAKVAPLEVRVRFLEADAKIETARADDNAEAARKAEARAKDLEAQLDAAHLKVTLHRQALDTLHEAVTQTMDGLRTIEEAALPVIPDDAAIEITEETLKSK